MLEAITESSYYGVFEPGNVLFWGNSRVKMCMLKMFLCDEMIVVVVVVVVVVGMMATASL